MKTINCNTATRIERTREVTMFLNTARRYEMRSSAEQKELCRKAKNGDAKAREELVNCNLLFIYSVCTKYANGNDTLDLVGCATIGLLNAIDLYDESRGTTFLSYAVRAMQDEIYQELHLGKPMIVNKAEYKIGEKVRRIKERFFQVCERYPTDGEIVAELAEQGIDANEYQVASMSFDSFSDIIGDDDATREECGEIAVATATDNEYNSIAEQEDKKAKISRLLDCLNPIERAVIEMSFGIGYDYEREIEGIASELYYSEENVRQIKIRALEKMRRVCQKENIAL